MSADLLDQVEARLRDQAMPPLQRVDGAAGFAALTGAGARLPAPHQLPAAYVIPIRTSGEGQRLVGATNQRLTHRFAVVIATGHAGETSGETASRTAQQVEAELRDRLVGWTPDGCANAVLYRLGAMTAFEGGRAWWTAEFETQQTLSKR